MTASRLIFPSSSASLAVSPATPPSHGWEAKSRIEAALGPEYGGLSEGYIYEVIHTMERDETIVSPSGGGARAG
jgi:DNA-binding PadR family transcriptional regulator